MTRLLVNTRHDLRLQWRNGFYYAAAVMLVLFALLLTQLPRADLRWLLPMVIVNNVIVNGFYFMAGLVLLEKVEGSLQAQVITPLRPREYLLSKILSLAFLSLLENGLLALLLLGTDISVLWLLLGITAGTSFFTLAGFLVVVRYQTVNEFLLPSLPVVTLLALPLLPYFGVGNAPWSALIILHPLQPVLLALRAATGAALSPTEVAYTLLYMPAVLLLALRRAESAYRRFVRQGAALVRRSS